MLNKNDIASNIILKSAVIALFLSVGGSSAVGKIDDGRNSEVGQWNKYFPIPVSYLNAHLLNKFQMPVQTGTLKSHIKWAFGELQYSLMAAVAQLPEPVLQAALDNVPSPMVPIPVSLPRTSSVPLPLARPAFKAPLQTPKGPGDYGVLSSVAIDIKNLPARKDWLSVSKGDYTGLFRQKCIGSAKVCRSDLATGVAAAASGSRKLPTLKRVSLINRAVNRALDYRSDQQIFGRADYWANPNEVAALGVGDCEDFAIAKLWALRAIGLNPEQLQFIVVKDTRRNVLHAVLAVHLDGGTYILDSLSDKVATQGAFRDYKPIMSFAANKSYIHGFDSKAVQTANRKVGRNNS
ncbi:transglutaminase-like cysteine peptidase [Pararhizobium sp. IMCC21322]|uniref:transglutaminase-like cysteine peptidase n=1 Tax=Pararhizobium sp. IMCC21322 TaxID=3067903 RepID=UPI0027403E43|nr:transglutaminase-like cysteine peptidase [Pararhizobium sp. IMCC21322]